MGKIDQVGVYRGKITESALGVTSKAGYPQWVVRLLATEKFEDNPDNFEHYKIEEPAWVPYEHNEDIVGYFCLFNDQDTFDETTKLLNYDLLVESTEWDGQSFNALNDGSLEDGAIQFEVEEDDYDGKKSIQVSWIRPFDAAPQGSLKKVDDDLLAKMNTGLKMGGGKPKTAAKAAAKPSATPAEKTATTKGKGKGKAAPKAAPKAEEAPPSTPPKAAPTAAPEAGDDMTQEKAWEFVNANKGENGDTETAESWLAGVGEVLEDSEAETEADLSDTEWGKVAKIALKDLAV